MSITKATKSLDKHIESVGIKVDGDSALTTEAKSEVHNVKTCLFSIQKDNKEVKKAIGELTQTLANMPVGQVAPPQAYQLIPRGGNVMPIQLPGQMQMGIPSNNILDDSQDDDFYMDDDLREQAEKITQMQIKGNFLESFKSLFVIESQKKAKSSPKKVARPPRTYSEDQSNEPIELQPISYADMTDILKEYFDTSVEVNEEYKLEIDCEDDNHITLLEVLMFKIIPHIHTLSFSNIGSNFELVSKFLYINHFSSLHTLILNEYGNDRLNMEYYVMALHNMMSNGVIMGSVVINEADISGAVFNILINSSCVCPISLEIQRASLVDFEAFKIEVQDVHHQLWGLEISYR